MYARGNQTASLTGGGLSGSSTGNGILRIGDTVAANQGHLGRIYEFVYYSVALTNDERDRLAAYMLWAVGEQAQINASNPYKSLAPMVVIP